MGQTLTHGVYLPAEGERNCYDGLASNWNILDGAVGTIAEHTTALAGKAPAVHTHTKSDVTDLLNSNFIPSANNSYDLGSSSYQWNNVYSKGYYYNGTAWGLDKVNHWTNNNTFDTTVRVKSLTQEIGVTPSESKYTYCDFRDKNEVNIAQIITAQFANGYDTISLNMYNKYTNGVKDPNGSSIDAKFETGLTPAGQAYLNTNGKWLCDLTPIVSNFNLGTATAKWKTLNGINPGALSLPDYLRILNIDTTNWSKTDGQNNYTPAFDGWLQITIPNDTDGNGEKSNFITILDSGFDPFTGITASDSKDYRIQITFPVVANHEYYIYIKSYSQTIMAARLIKCLGNVV